MSPTGELSGAPSRAGGTNPEPIPYRLDGVVPIGEVTSDPRATALAPGASSGWRVTVAGRLMRVRTQGRLCFAQLRDWTGSIQLFAVEATTEGFRALSSSSLGDWVGATGQVMRTRRGELSVQVATWRLLARARRGFGDKWRGVHDVEVRHRHREIDLWANEGIRELFLLRSKVVGGLRRQLEARGFVEVETPVLHSKASGAHARPFVTHHNALHADFALRIATEIYLKRLVVGGFERVFEIGRIFRNEGLSPKHNPEFTMLEAYQAYADYTDMMELTEHLVSTLAREVVGSVALAYQGRPLDLTPPWRRATLEELIVEHTGVEVDLAMGRHELARRAARLGVAVDPADGPGKVVLEIYEKTTEGELWGPVHVCDYPKEVSPLARDHRSRPGYVERFESVLAGRELANAFSELADPDEQRRRLEAQAAERAAGDEEAMVLDEDFLAALEHGMPPTGGLGIGVDRLVMLLADAANIREVILFPALRPLRAGTDPDEDGEPGPGAERDEPGATREEPGTTAVETLP